MAFDKVIRPVPVLMKVIQLCGEIWDIGDVVVKTRQGWRLLEVWNVPSPSVEITANRDPLARRGSSPRSTSAVSLKPSNSRRGLQTSSARWNPTWLSPRLA